MLGIDVSHHQGQIDWTLVKQSGVKFVYAKAGERGFTDPRYDQYRAACRALDIPFGSYWFAKADSDPAQQVDLFVALLDGKDDLVPVLDAERSWTGAAGPNNDWCYSFLQSLSARTGQTPALYCSTSYLFSPLQKDPRLAQFPLWVADYRGVTPPTPWPYACWQYESKGRVPGITGNVDLDRTTNLGPLRAVRETVPAPPVSQPVEDDMKRLFVKGSGPAIYMEVAGGFALVKNTTDLKALLASANAEVTVVSDEQLSALPKV